ncbi:MAG: hypothetical protein L3J23_01800 [Flavobacteriaceae bacterium]|nr:hypothetical protein [Flavobacteriaceae bacterium]
MKKTITIAFILSLFINLYAQEPEISIDSMLVNIDKTSFTTNVLYDKTMPWSQLSTFNEEDKNVSSLKHFEQALNELYNASDKQKFVSYKSVRTNYTHRNNKNTVDVGILNASFHELNFNSNDETKGGLRLSTNTNKFEKLTNDKPAFKEKHVLVIAPLKEYLVGSDITFKFDNTFFIEETETKKIQTLIANFDTETDYTIINDGIITTNNIQVHYNNEGYKTLIFTATFTDGTTKTTSSVLHTKLAFIRPPQSLIVDGTITADIPFQGYDGSPSLLGELEYRIYHHTNNGNTQGVLLKPIVIIDGFDPGDERKIEDSDSDLPSGKHTSIFELMEYTDNNATPPEQSLVTNLRALGYDVIIVNHITYERNNVDIDGGADYIERNAMAHVALYQHLNTLLNQNNSDEKLVIMGPSMGGQISRYALAYMEDHNLEHNTRLWVSVDSPHLGANIPIGMQAMMNLLDAFGDSTAAADFYNNRLKSVAGNQQLIEQHLPYHLPDHLNNGSPVRQQYLSNLTSNGLDGSNGYPQNLRKIAMVNGSLMGINVDVAGIEDFRIHGFINQLWWTVKVAEMNTNYMPNTGQTKQIARLWRRFKPNRTATYTNNNPNGSMDIVPGGLFDTEDQLHSAVLGDDPGISNWGNGINIQEVLLAYYFGIWGDFFSSRTNKEIHSFVPTVSALGFKNPNFNWSQKLDRNLVCSNEIPFDNYYGPQTNTQHVSFTKESIDWLFAELDVNTPNPPPSVYLDGDIQGSFFLCNNNNEEYYFNNCIIPSNPVWEVSSNLQIIGSNNNETVLVQKNGNNGSGFIKAIFDNETITKTIWVGNPSNQGQGLVGDAEIDAFSPHAYNLVSNQTNVVEFYYDWTVPSQWSPPNEYLDGFGNKIINILSGSQGSGGLVSVEVSNSCGTVYADMNVVVGQSGDTSKIIKIGTNKYKVFNILTGEYENITLSELYDIYGNKKQDFNSNQEEMNINYHSNSGDIRIIKANVNGEILTKTIIVD